MYIPSFNISPDKQEVISFMRKYSFGTIITSVDNIPIATHLPFLIDEKDDQLIISSHFAKANPQALNVDGILTLSFSQNLTPTSHPKITRKKPMYPHGIT